MTAPGGEGVEGEEEEAVGLDEREAEFLHIYTTVYTHKNAHNLRRVWNTDGARGSAVVKALCYKPEGRGFETR
jgi:hypothetical protein